MTFGDPRLPDRFWEKVITVPFSGCWLWIAATNKKGYGYFWFKGKKQWAHRLVKDFKQTAHHKCFTNCCVNPDHLEDVSREHNSHLGHHDEWANPYKWDYTQSTPGDDVPF